MDYKHKYIEALGKAREMMSYKEVRCEDMEYLFPELKETKRGDTREELISYLEGLLKFGISTNYGKWTKTDCAKWIEWVKKQDPTWFEEKFKEAHKDVYRKIKQLLETELKQWKNGNSSEAKYRVEMLKELIDKINK